MMRFFLPFLAIFSKKMPNFRIKSQKINSYGTNFKELVYPSKLGTPQAWMHISTNKEKQYLLPKNAIFSPSLGEKWPFSG